MSRSRPERAAAVAAAILLAAALAAPAGDDPEEPVLRDEDVVRMLVAGASEDEVIRNLRSSRTEFDLSDEMIEEMRVAGVSERVLQAMRERQAAIDGAKAPPGSGSREAEEGSPLVVRIRVERPPKKEVPPRLEFPGLAPPALAAALELGPSVEKHAVGGAAVYLACLTADHVPNQWRRESPLGRDFFSVPRHRMLAFLPAVERIPASGKVPPGEERTPAGEVFERIELAIPDLIEAEVDPGVVHDLTLGIAVEIGGRYYRMTSAETTTQVAHDDGLRLEAEIVGRLDDGFRAEIRFLAPGRDD